MIVRVGPVGELKHPVASYKCETGICPHFTGVFLLLLKKIIFSLLMSRPIYNIPNIVSHPPFLIPEVFSDSRRCDATFYVFLLLAYAILYYYYGYNVK